MKLDYKTLSHISDRLSDLVLLPDLTSRRYRFKQLYNNYPDELNILISYAFELPKVTLLPLQNSFTKFNYNQDFGELVYSLLNNEPFHNFNILPYKIQKLINILTSKYIIVKLTQDFLLTTIDKYYKLSELLLDLEIPDVINKSEIYIQGLKRDKINTLKFPIYIYKIPNKTKYKQFQYLIYQDGKYVSNINSGIVRDYIKNNVNALEYGIIGISVKEKGFKRKYKFIPLYFNYNVENVKDIYKNKQTTYNNRLEDYIEQVDLIKLNNEDELIEFVRKQKRKSKFVVLSDNGIEIFKPDITYKNVKIIDYIYTDEFEANGLIVELEDNLYNIYFNVMETSYVDGIEDKFVRVSVVSYKGSILNVYYNSELKAWSRISNECKVCGKVDSKHNRDGVCNSCIYKFEKYVEIVNRECVVDCGSEFDTIVGNYRFKSDGSKLVVSCVGICQQNLDLFEGKICESI